MSTPFHINRRSLDQTPGVQKEVNDLPWYCCASLVKAEPLHHLDIPSPAAEAARLLPLPPFHFSSEITGYMPYKNHPLKRIPALV